VRLAHHGDDQIDPHLVLAPLGDDEIGPALRRFHELQVHGPDGAVVLLANRLEAPAAFLDVAADPSKSANVGIGVDIDLDVEQLSDALLDEDEDALQDDDRRRLHLARLLGTTVILEIVDRQRDRRATFERLEMRDEQRGLERLGVVVVELAALVVREIDAIAVIRVVLDHNDARGRKRRRDPLRNGGFSGPAPPGDSDDEWALGHRAAPYPKGPTTGKASLDRRRQSARPSRGRGPGAVRH